VRRRNEIRAGRVVNVFLGAVAIALAANIVYMLISRRPVRAATQPVAFTTTLKETPFNAKGESTATNYYTFAVRSDGSSLIKVTIGGESRRIIDFTSRVQVRVRDVRELKSSFSSAPVAVPRDPNAGCLQRGETSLGAESVAGYHAVKVGKGERTSWYAPEHGCALVREIWKFHTGEVSEKTLISLVMGEPDAALFYVPHSYEEVPPSKYAGKPPTDPRYARLDKYYFEHRPATIP
jgi:hypothetical protein